MSVHPAVRHELETFARDLRRNGCADADDLFKQVKIVGQSSLYQTALGSEADQPTDDDFREIVEASRLTRFRSDEEVENFTPPALQIDGLFPRGGLVVLFGPPGSGKTFVSLDWGNCIGTGMRWQGRQVREPGAVVQVLAEGSGGVGPRLKAWKRRRNWAGSANVYFLTEPVSLLDRDDVHRFTLELLALDKPPVMVVFDTLARCMIGGDENSAADMGRAIESADAIRRATGATVVLIHHTNKSGDTERGSTALRGAADTMVSVKDEDGVITLRCEKQKDAEPFHPVRLRLERVLDSCVLEGANDALHLTAQELTPQQRQALEDLHRLAPSHGLTATQWEELAKMPRRSFFAARKALHEGGYVEMDKEGRGALYTLTPQGFGAVGAKVQEGADEGAGGPAGRCVQVPGSTKGPGTAPTDPARSGFTCTNGCGRDVGGPDVECIKCRFGKGAA